LPTVVGWRLPLAEPEEVGPRRGQSALSNLSIIQSGLPFAFGWLKVKSDFICPGVAPPIDHAQPRPHSAHFHGN
jgi:hypothetical protein